MGAFEDWDMASVVAYQKRLELLQGKKTPGGIKDIGQKKIAVKNPSNRLKYHNEKVEHNRYDIRQQKRV